MIVTLQAPTAGTIKRKQSEFGAQLGHVMQQVIPGMHAASGQIHSLAFSMPAIEDAELSSKELLSARSSLEVHTHRTPSFSLRNAINPLPPPDPSWS